ncbi:Secreted lipase [Pseudocercospora fuligena]|uniref:Secreted lipase n=1 Tax=Pseudocercospora fuligena TaxID=685502 RepID=A0A8H6RFT4_9PEZI|nr:Secreted lipase [Pseudocercospora fuligena]
MTTTKEVQMYLELLLPRFSHSSIQKILELYPLSEFHDLHPPKNFTPPTPPKMNMTSVNGTTNSTEAPTGLRPLPTAQFRRAVQITTDLFMVCIPLHFGKILQSSGKGDIYYYHHNRSIAENQHPLFSLVQHGAEIPYVIGNISAFSNHPPGGECCIPGEEDKILQHTQSGSWGSFTALGKPSLEGKTTLQGWKEADFEDEESYGIYVVGSPFQGGAGKGGNKGAREEIKKRRWKEKCQFWNSPEIVKELGW